MPSLTDIPDELAASLAQAAAVTLPLLCFLTAAVAVTELVAGSGLVGRAGILLARAGRGRNAILFGLVCAAGVACTLTVSLDGAVVVMVPVVTAVGAVTGIRREALLLGVIAVANAASPALPQGNPTNLIVIARLDISSRTFAATMLGPAAVATALCLLAVCLRERRFLRCRYTLPPHPPGRLTAGQWSALAVALAAAAAQAAAPWLGIAPWWPICAVAAAVLAGRRLAGRRSPPLRVPWRIGAQLLALATLAGLVVRAAGLQPAAGGARDLPALVAVAVAAGLLAALINNLPASVVVASTMAPGPAVYAALLGLSVGALASARGSVATVIALDLADRPTAAAAADRYARWFVPAALTATAAAAAGLAAGR